jgi:hypothetical protein
VLPGQYLEKRRIMAGHSLTSLASELLKVTGFGAGYFESDFRRLRLLLIAAEQGSEHHSPERIDLIRNFVPLDRAIYLRLVELAQGDAPYDVAGICRNCACSFFDPCITAPPRSAAHRPDTCFWVNDTLCSACAGITERTAPPASKPGRDMPLTEAMLTPVPAAGGPSMTGIMLRLVPKEGEN